MEQFHQIILSPVELLISVTGYVRLAPTEKHRRKSPKKLFKRVPNYWYFEKEESTNTQLPRIENCKDIIFEGKVFNFVAS